jgi:uncharacterized protein (DUF433 family)
MASPRGKGHWDKVYSTTPADRVSWYRPHLEISLRLQRFPGITFIEGPTGRRAHVVGTGLDVWEIVALLRDYGFADAVIAAFPRLTKSSVDIAQAYASAYPEEIKEYLEWLERSPEQIVSEFPHVTRAKV